ncbi:MAG TPA: methytransferase partner Trm112 [Tepidiformaceae bacterium]|nr:methytransferase partner Trm112 [Tepidiformaceae bacterium]
MQPTLLEILCCPLCKAELELKITDERDGEIVTGTLTCRECRERYPIDDGIPNMLPPEQRG